MADRNYRLLHEDELVEDGDQFLLNGNWVASDNHSTNSTRRQMKGHTYRRKVVADFVAEPGIPIASGHYYMSRDGSGPHCVEKRAAHQNKHPFRSGDLANRKSFDRRGFFLGDKHPHGWDLVEIVHITDPRHPNYVEPVETTEKDRRFYYQDMIYKICNLVDEARNGQASKGTGVVCGTVDSPSTELVDVLRSLLDVHISNQLFSLHQTKEFKRAYNHQPSMPPGRGTKEYDDAPLLANMTSANWSTATREHLRDHILEVGNALSDAMKEEFPLPIVPTLSDLQELCSIIDVYAAPKDGEA